MSRAGHYRVSTGIANRQARGKAFISPRCSELHPCSFIHERRPGPWNCDFACRHPDSARQSPGSFELQLLRDWRRRMRKLSALALVVCSALLAVPGDGAATVPASGLQDRRLRCGRPSHPGAELLLLPRTGSAAVGPASRPAAERAARRRLRTCHHIRQQRRQQADQAARERRWRTADAADRPVVG